MAKKKDKKLPLSYILGGVLLLGGLGGAYALYRSRSGAVASSAGTARRAPRLPMAKPFRDLSRREIAMQTAAHQQQWREGGGLERYCANNPNHPRCVGEYSGPVQDLWSAGTSLFDRAARATEETTLRAGKFFGKGASDAADLALDPIREYRRERAAEIEQEDKLKKKLQRAEQESRKARRRMFLGLTLLGLAVASPFILKKKGR